MTDLFNPHSNAWLQNKFEIYKDLRSRKQAYWSEKYQVYVITRYEDVIFALSNPDIFSSAMGNLIVEDPARFGKTLGASDNPIHNTYKNIVRNAYSKDNISRILETVETKFLSMISGNNVLNMSDVADHTSAWIVAEILNLPFDKSTIQSLIVGTQKYGRSCVNVDINDLYEWKLKNLLKFFSMAEGDLPASPGPGIYHEYIHNNPDRTQAMSLFLGPCISGASSMTGGLEFLTLDLYRENLLNRVFQNQNLIPQAVNESLRFNASTGRFRRTVTKEIKMHGITLKPGDAVVLSLESANRDPDKFEDPDRFILERDTTGVAFGHGVHACIALAISKAVMNSYLKLLLDNFGLYKVLTENKDLKYVMTCSGNDDMISNLVIEKVGADV